MHTCADSVPVPVHLILLFWLLNIVDKDGVTYRHLAAISHVHATHGVIAHAHAGAAGHGRHVHSAHIHFDSGYRDHELKKTEGCKK